LKVLQINTTVNSGSTGRIAEDIGNVLIANGHESYVAYGRGNRPSNSELVKIGAKKDVYLHGVKTLFFDRHGFGSACATKALVKEIDRIKPDVIGLHNLHGYYVHIDILFNYLEQANIPVVWTLFDCWAFTGHCTYFDDINCRKWKNECNSCPKTKKYPSSYGLDNSRMNFMDKKYLFNLPENLEIIVHSNWLKGLVEQSFLSNRTIHHVFSGIDLEKFKIHSVKKSERKIILGVASIWDTRKGLTDFFKLDDLITEEYQIVLIGLTKQQIKTLPKGVKGIERTESTESLTEFYNMAAVFINPTYQDNFPTTNIEALACGTPLITYNTGGSPEAIDENTGRVVEKGDVQGLWKAIKELKVLPQEQLRNDCRTRAEKHFDKNDRYQDYLNLYEQLVNEKNN
jgi:glycosyltransferase involved in cell wall biosynthesis